MPVSPKRITSLYCGYLAPGLTQYCSSLPIVSGGATVTATNCDEWPLTSACLPDDWDADDLTPEQQQAVDQATEWIAEATGGIWGQCDYTSHHCPPITSGNSCLPSQCHCIGECQFHLAWPADGPVTVEVNGSSWSSAWRIIDEHTLVLDNCPPTCADVAISYRRGWPVVEGDRASRAMTILAVRLHADPCFGTGDCAPPHNATRITRDAWTVELDPTVTAIVGDLTGIRNIDRLIEWSRSLLAADTGIKVWSPDIPAGDSSRWRVTDTGTTAAGGVISR